MIFEIKKEDGDELFINKSIFGGFYIHLSNIFESLDIIITEEEAKELINYLQKELENETM